MNDNKNNVLKCSTRLQDLPSYGRGRIAKFPSSTARLGSNENTNRPSQHAINGASDTLADLNRYPDLRGESLCYALADFYGLAPDQVAVSAGSVVMLELMVRAYCDAGDKIVTGWPSYEAYPLITGAHGCILKKADLTTDLRVDLDAVSNAIDERTRIVLICNPNNPTGTAHELSTIETAMERLPQDRLIILDEAYAEYTGSNGQDIRRMLDKFPNLTILRTFSKAYGLAGMRIGYCMASKDIVQAVQSIQPPFPLPTPALSAAIAALREQDLLAAHIHQTTTERKRLINALREINLAVTEAGANFVYLPLLDQSESFANHMREDHDVITRCYADEGVRITLAGPEETTRVINGARAWVAKKISA